MCIGLGPRRRDEHRLLGEDSEEGHTTTMTKGLKHLSCEDRLRDLEFFSLEKAPGKPNSSLPVSKGSIQESQRGAMCYSPLSLPRIPLRPSKIEAISPS